MKLILKSTLRILSLGRLMFASCKQIMAQYGVPVDALFFRNNSSTSVKLRLMSADAESIKDPEVQFIADIDTIVKYSDYRGIAEFSIDSKNIKFL